MLITKLNLYNLILLFTITIKKYDNWYGKTASPYKSVRSPQMLRNLIARLRMK